MTRTQLASLLVLTFTLLPGCGSAPAKPTPTKAVITASADVNPNHEGRASPVHVRIFQLKEEGAFMDADFWSLVDKEQQTLAGSLLQRLEQNLAPGERKELELEIDPQASVLAVMAEFADYRDATWRATVKTPDESLMDLIKKHQVIIDVRKDSVLVSVGR